MMKELKLGEHSTKSVLHIMMQIPEITNILNAYLEAKEVNQSYEPIIEIKFKPQENK